MDQKLFVYFLYQKFWLLHELSSTPRMLAFVERLLLLIELGIGGPFTSALLL